MTPTDATLATLTPSSGKTAEQNTVRKAYNTWLGTLPGDALDVFDFGAAVANATNDALAPAYDSGDALHLNTAGSTALAGAVRLLIDRTAAKRADQLADATVEVELASRPDFQQRFLAQEEQQHDALREVVEGAGHRHSIFCGLLRAAPHHPADQAGHPQPLEELGILVERVARHIKAHHFLLTPEHLGLRPDRHFR